MPKPMFNTALGASVLTSQSKPPMRFEGVSSRMFPIKANMGRLRAFCDSYMNVAPEIAEFQPAFPYVYLMIIDYGKMSPQYTNVGWVSQREVAFAVPLEWYDMTQGRKFRDFAAVCPFIYVDDWTSLSTGRQVYGWPKVKAWETSEVNSWAHDALAPQRLLELSTMVFPEMYSGDRQEPEILLEVIRNDLSPFSRFPANPGNPSNPLSMIPDAMQTYLKLFGSMFEMAARPAAMGYGPASLDPIQTLIGMGRQGIESLRSPVPSNNITLKQFRDTQDPDAACYQALINSEIRTNQITAGGMLGDRNLMFGDPSGGYQINIHRYASQPIVESLGLEVSHEVNVDNHSMAVLRPMFPFWIEMDMQYGLGHQICWRSKESEWSLGSAGVPPQAREESTSVQVPAQPVPQLDDKFGSRGRHPYNSTRSGALQGVAGPFDFPNVTIRVLPLLADPERLKSFIADYLENTEYEFEAWGSYVYMMVTNYEEMSSTTNNIGWWADRAVSFFVPVKMRKEGKLVSLGMVPAFSYANTSTAAITGSEVNGIPTLQTVLNSPEEVWMAESGPSYSAHQPLLTCEVDVLPALYVGAKGEKRTVVQVKRSEALPYNDDIGWRMVGADWGHKLLNEHRRMCNIKKQCNRELQLTKGLALEMLAHHHPINSISLKQFRDAAEPDAACYQAIVRGRRVIERIYDLQEIEDNLHVYIEQQPTQPIVEVLGLQTKWSEVTGAGKVDILQPLRPFWAKVGFHEDLGDDLCWRAGSEEWSRKGSAEDLGYFGEDTEHTNVGPGVLVGLGTEAHEYGYPMRRQHLRSTAQKWLETDKEAAEHWTRAEARSALEAIEPQMAIEGILSAEWEHWGAPRWYRQKHRGEDELQIKADFCIRRDSVGGVREQNRFFADHPGWSTHDGAWYSEDEKPHKLNSEK